MRKFTASSSSSTASRIAASVAPASSLSLSCSRRLSSSANNSEEGPSPSPVNAATSTVTPPTAIASVNAQPSAPMMTERMKVFASVFCKTFVAETIAHSAVTRRTVRNWTKNIFNQKTDLRRNQQHRIDVTKDDLARIAMLRSLAIRTPGSNKGGSNSPASEGKKDDDGAKAGSDDGKVSPPSSPAGKKKKEVAGKDSKNKKNGGGDDDGEDGGNDADLETDAITPMVTKFVLAVFILSGVLYWVSKPSGKLCSWEAVTQRTDALMRVDIYHNFAEFHFAEGPSLHVGLLDDDGHTERKLKETLARCTLGDGFSTNWIGESFSESMLHFVGVFAWIVPFIFFPSFVMILTRAIGTAMTGVQEGKNKVTSKVMFHVHKGSNTRFSDIAGMTEAKQEVTEIVDFLKHPERYTRLGAKVPTGALLLGPPGTGKTLLAKAVAGEAGVAFIPCTGSDFVELYVGMGALRVRQLFELAKKQRCIIYIDEIDAIGLKRSGAGHGEKQEQEHTLNELLTQLDGFGSNRGEVMILASSNVSQQELDPALIRPGRFDRLVNVDAPVIKERIDIFKVHLSNLKLVPNATNFTNTTTNTAVPARSTPAAPAPTATDKLNAALDDKPIDSDKEIKMAPVFTSAATPPEPTKATEDTPNTAAAAATDVAKAEDSNTTTTTKGEEAKRKPVIEPWFTEEEAKANTDELNKDIARKKMVAAAQSALDEKLSKLSAEEKALVEQYAVRMSDLCPGFVGADIMNVCNEAAILAAREDCNCVDITHLERSIDRVLAGIEHRSRVLSPFEKKVVAHHEAGHAVAGWFLGRADPLMKVSIVPRGGSALGYAQYLPNENHLRTSNEIKDSICVTLGGRVAEKIFFDHLSTGASDDLRKVTRMAYMHVSSFNTTTAHQAPGTKSTRYVKPYGAAISDKIDVAAKALVDEMFERTLTLLTEKKKEMEQLANHLLTHEVLTHADVVGYLGERPPRPSDAKKYYLVDDKHQEGNNAATTTMAASSSSSPKADTPSAATA